MAADFCSLASVGRLADRLYSVMSPIDLLMNNAGTLDPRHIETVDGLAPVLRASAMSLVPLLLYCRLLPLMHSGSRIVNMVSCTYAIGKITLPEFFYPRTQRSFGVFLYMAILNLP